MSIQVRWWGYPLPSWITPSLTDVLFAAEEWNTGMGIGQGSAYLQTIKALMLAGF